MTHPAIELQGAIFSTLTASTQLTNLLGANRIFDDVPTGTKPPYIVFGKSVQKDWSTDSESGMEHEISLHIWSRENGRKQVLQVQETIIAALASLGGAMTNHHLINFSHERSEIEMRDKLRAFRGISMFRAVTEPIV